MKTKSILKLLAMAVFFFIGFQLHSQQTGMFNKVVPFNGEQRTLAYFVPNDYDETQQYSLMVCLHGMGDTCTNYRDALFLGLAWHQFITNTIFVCPDAGSDIYKDFYRPDGDEMIIIEAINDAKSNYNIDDSKIILQGFSLGGRSALKFGLDNPELFQGLLLNTPAIQGLVDLNNDPLMSSLYKYENSTKVPIFIIHGTEDFTYLSMDRMLYDKLIEHNGVVRYALVQGLAHHIPARNVIENAVSFLKNPTPNENEIEFLDIIVKARYFTNDITAYCRVRNTGSGISSTQSIDFELNDTKLSAESNKELKSFEYSDIPLELGSQNLGFGTHFLSVLLDGYNKYTKSFAIFEKGARLPVFEGFDSGFFPAQNWILNESGNLVSWMLDPEVKKSGSYSIFMFNSLFLLNNIGYSEDLLSPVLDLSSVEKPVLTFDVAYNYHLYTPPYFTNDYALSDTLKVFISEDCGETYTLIYKKGGAELATADEPIINPLDIEECFFVPNSDEWRTEQIDLSNFKHLDKAVFNFSYQSSLGGSINIDNINFKHDDGTSVQAIKESGDLLLYPNPAQDFLRIKNPEPISKVRIFSSNGLEIYSNDLGLISNELTVNLSEFSSGFYIVEIYCGSSVLREKLIVNKK